MSSPSKCKVQEEALASVTMAPMSTAMHFQFNLALLQCQNKSREKSPIQLAEALKGSSKSTELPLNLLRSRVERTRSVKLQISRLRLRQPLRGSHQATPQPLRRLRILTSFLNFRMPLPSILKWRSRLSSRKALITLVDHIKTRLEEHLNSCHFTQPGTTWEATSSASSNRVSKCTAPRVLANLKWSLAIHLPLPEETLRALR